MSIKAPTWTQVPNELFVLMPDMDKSELKVVLAVCRMTIGWHKEKDRLTITRLMTLTGLSRQAVYDGVDAAKKRGILTQEETQQDGYIYSLDIEPSNGETPPIYSLDAVSVQSLDTQKKSVQKKKSKEKISIAAAPICESPLETPTPSIDENFGVFVKEVERRTSHIPPRDFQKMGELWDEHPDIDAFIYALDEMDKRGVGFNFVYFEKCLFTFEDQKERKKNGGYLKTSAGDDGPAGNGRRNGNGTPRGDFRAGRVKPPFGNAPAEPIPRLSG